MYRSMSPKVIYCSNDGNCDLKCGRFHKSLSTKIHRNHQKNRILKAVQSLDIPTTSNENSPTRLSVSNSNEPSSPFSNASTVTLEDILASARRKISADFQPILLPSPIFLDEDPTTENTENMLFKKKRKNSDCSSQGIEELDEDFFSHLVDSDDEGYWFNADPPSLIIDDDLADFDELMKVTGPPKDHFSNPIERGADPLNKKRHKLIVDDFDDGSSVDFSIADVGPQDFTHHKFSFLTAAGQDKPEYEGDL